MFFPEGIITSMVTSFQKSSEVDYQGIIENIKFQKKAGIKSVCVLGGTGEATSLSQKERHEIMEVVMNNADDLNVVFGALTGNFLTVMDDIKKAKDCGADACLVMPPPFIVPSDRDIKRYMTELSKIGMPLILFNTPGRLGLNMSTSLISSLSEVEGIIGIKESSGSIVKIQNIMKDNKKFFSILTGADNLYLPSMALGANGGLLALSAVVPELLLEINNSIENENYVKARKYHYMMKKLDEMIYKESHPVPLKIAMKYRGLPVGECRYPFKDIEKNHEKQIYNIMKEISKETTDSLKFVSDYSF